MKGNKAITLIALVITIIILLILAGITILAIDGNNGLFMRANQAKEETMYTQTEEEIKIILNEWQIENIDQKQTLKEFLDSKVPNSLDKVTDNEDGTYTVERNGYEAIINSNGEIVGRLEKIDISGEQGSLAPKCNIISDYIRSRNNIVFTFSFSIDVIGFDETDINLSSNSLDIDLTNDISKTFRKIDDANYTLDIIVPSGKVIDIIASVEASKCTDNEGRGNLKSNINMVSETYLLDKMQDSSDGDTINLNEGVYILPTGEDKIPITSLNIVGIPGKTKITGIDNTYVSFDSQLTTFTGIIFENMIISYNKSDTNYTYYNCVFNQLLPYSLSAGIVANSHVTRTVSNYYYCTFYGNSSCIFGSYAASEPKANFYNCISSNVITGAVFPGRKSWIFTKNSTLEAKTINITNWTTTDTDVGVWYGEHAWK